MTKRVDVVVIGAGPAGAIAALNLRPFHSVLVIDQNVKPVRRIGESLLPAATPLLREMNLWADFEAENFLPWFANQSVWGNPAIVENDFLRDPTGHGWHIDRARFEALLRRAAIKSGAEILAPAKLTTVAKEDRRINLLLGSGSGSVEVEADFIIDAGGRGRPAAHRLGAKSKVDFPLICAGVYGGIKDEQLSAGIAFTEAVKHGWWYSAPIPGRRRILAFHTDSDNPAFAFIRDRQGLLEQVEKTSELRRLLSAVGFQAEEKIVLQAASGSSLSPPAGDRWLATGDAALSFDPLSSQGLFNAMFLGLRAAQMVRGYLAGERSGITNYCSTVGGIRSAYCAGIREAYRLEGRWREAEFWKRRQ